MQVAASVLVVGLGGELARSGVAVSALWPATGIRSAVTDVMGADARLLRTPQVFADACLAVLQVGRAGRGAGGPGGRVCGGPGLWRGAHHQWSMRMVCISACSCVHV